MTDEVAIEDMGKWLRRMSARIDLAARRGVHNAGLKGVQKIVSQIIPSRSPAPVDRGVYRAGWKVRVVSNGDVYVENAETHAAFIEYGVRPENVKVGRAMIEALTEWAMRKGIADDEDEAKGIAFGIANRMKERGIFNRYQGGTGLHILGELIDTHMPEMMREEIAREVNKEIKK